MKNILLVAVGYWAMLLGAGAGPQSLAGTDGDSKTLATAPASTPASQAANTPAVLHFEEVSILEFHDSGIYRVEPCRRRTDDGCGNRWEIMLAVQIDGRAPGGPSELWIGRGHGEARKPVEPNLALPPGPWERDSICTDDFSFVWAGNESGLLRLDPRQPAKGWVRFPHELLGGSADRPASITALVLGPNGLVLAGLASGRVYEVDISETGVPAATLLGQSPDGKGVRDIRCDSWGSIWMDTYDKHFKAAPRQGAWQSHWQAQPCMPWGDHDIFGAVLNNTLYIPGGLANHGMPARMLFFDTMFRYCHSLWNRDDGGWDVSSPMPEPVAYCGVAALDEKIWVIGGATGESNKRRGLKRVMVYGPKDSLVGEGDWERKRWTSGPDLDQPRQEPVVVACKGRIYVIGGADKENLDSVVSIGPGEKAWRAEPNAPQTIRQTAGCELDGVIYVVAPGPRGLLAFDVQAGTWKNLRSSPGGSPRAALVTAHNGEVWVMGGWDTKTPLATWRYCPKDQAWRPGPDLPTPLGWGAAVELDGKIVIAGGAYHSHGYYIFSDRVYQLREGWATRGPAAATGPAK